MKNINNNRPNEEWWKNVNATEWENEVIRRKNEGDSDYVEMEKYILNYFKKFNDVKILDYGCGFGRNSLNLLKNTKNEIFGVDINKSMTEVVSQKIQDKNYTNTHFKVLAKDKTIPFPDNYFDYTFTNEVLIHVHPDDVLDTLKEIFRVTNNKILLLENILVSKSVQSNLAHNGCWLHDFISIITRNVPYELTITSGIISRQDIYEIDKTSSSKMITLYSNKGKITDIDKIYRIGDQNLISNLNKENSGNIYWINQKNTLIDTLEKNNEKINKKLLEYKKEIKINKNKITNLDQELINIHNSKLWKTYLIYKKIYNKIWIPKIFYLSKQTENKNTNYYKLIKGNYSNNKVLGICHEDWNGIKEATKNQCSKVLLIREISSYTHAKIIYEKIIKGRYKKICINGLPDNIEYLVDYIGNTDNSVKMYMVWHGSYTQQSENQDHIWRLNKLSPYFNKIYKFGFVKKDSEKIFSLIGLRSFFIPNLIDIKSLKKFRQAKDTNSSSTQKNINIFIPSLFLWHKNNVNQIIAAALIKKSKVSVLNFPNMKYLNKIFKNKIMVNDYLDKINFYKKINESDIISYVSLTECYPMVLLESLALEKPCLVGKTSEFIFNKNDYLKKYLVVENPEDIFEIKQKIIDVINNYGKIIAEINKFLPELIIKNKKIVDSFFND